MMTPGAYLRDGQTMKDHRAKGADGNPIPFTCENSRYKTSSSVFGGDPLAEYDGYQLRLEKVEPVDRAEPDCYWFMWYRDGKPTIPMSGVRISTTRRYRQKT